MSSLPGTPTSPSTRRNSLSQLPLPSAVNSPKSSTPPPLAGPSSPKVPTYSAPRVPLSHTAARPSIPPPSSTHASGILPSASFFRPSRPNHQPQGYRRHSVDSDDAVPRDGDVFQMSSLSKQISHSSDGHEPDHVNPAEDTRITTTRKGSKKGRDPILPIVNRTSLGGRPSLSRELSTSSNPSKGTRAIIRTSLDRVFNLSRGISVDSFHQPSQHSGRRLPDDADSANENTFEGKFGDEEAGIYGSRRVSYARRKDSSSPGHFTHRLDVSRGVTSPSPDQSFVPTPPSPTQNLRSIPFKNPETGKIVRNHQLHPSSNHFFLQGRLLTGGDSPWAFIASFSIVLGIAGVWFGTTAIWWWNNESPAVAAVVAYLALLTIVTMLTTALSDPGILPRGLDPDPPYPPHTPEDGIKVPMPRDLKVRADVVRVKYCHTCRTYRPPRSSHCRMCDNCVDGCDHHCQWVNNCIGHRNYNTFFVLLLTATITLILVIITSALHIYFVATREHLAFKDALRTAAGSAVGFCLSIIVIWPVAALLTYHMRLLLLNITTIEQIRNQAHKSLGEAPPNPFTHGSWFKNLMAVLCRPVGYSWLDFHAVAMEDKREINPGLIDQ